MSRGAVPLPYAVPEGHGARNRGERLLVIANPRAGGGRAGRERALVERAVCRAFERAEVRWTEGPGHAAELARAAAADADIVAALGGDGTCHEVVNGLFVGNEPVNRRAIFAVLPYGTGGDLVRSLDVKGTLEDALWIASTGMTLPLDVGRAEWGDGRAELFINVAGIGANAEVCRVANRSSKRLGGRFTFVSAIFETLATYRPVPVRWTWEGPEGSGSLELETLAAFCANGHFCGAGLWVGRDGSMADGLFDLTLIPRMGGIQAARLLPRAYQGRFDGMEGLVRTRASVVTAASPVGVELDGEPRDPAPIRFSVLPRALQVRGGWLRPPVAPI